MPDDTYHRDILAWSEAQAARLRRLAAGEGVDDVDWAHVIEEIESVGRSEVQAVEAFLLQAFLHAMKVAAWPDHSAARKWRNEIDAVLLGARRRFAPSLGPRVEVPAIHRDARRLVLKLDMQRPARALRETTDLTVATLMDEEFDAKALIARLAAPA